jgi:mannose-1-phosphate guanylyltransferase/mannose-6-phosphate isomerase
LVEPVGRNTAPAIAAAALQVAAKAPDAVLLVLPSDHLIGDVPAFHRAARQAAALAAPNGHLVTFGIAPTEPATGYGYIEAGAPIAGSKGAFRIRRFVEKPSAAKARTFLAKGGFLWNSGMFAFTARRYLEELGRFRPDILAATRAAIDGATRDLDFIRLESKAFAACPAESVDYAVMERTDRGAVVRARMRWSDVGSWAALWDVGRKDKAKNVARGDVWLHDAKGCYVRADGRHVSLLGAENLIVVETDDAVLVASRDRAQDVKEVVARFDRSGRNEHVAHSRVYRPWGYYRAWTQVIAGEAPQVKRGPGTSRCSGAKRAEHWVVVAGAPAYARRRRAGAMREPIDVHPSAPSIVSRM